MRKLVLGGVCIFAGALALACSSSGGSNPGADFNHGAGGTANGSGGSGGSGAVQHAPYPAGPYGYKIGSTIENKTFYGWKDPAAAKYDTKALQKLSFSDFYDPDGSKGIKLIMLNVSAVWCTVCQAEYSQLTQENKYATYKPKGVEFFGVLFEDINHNPAQPSDLKTWTKGYNVRFPMVIDPGFWFGHFFTADATPMNLVIDARNMKIVGQVLGGDTTTLWQTIDSKLAGK